MKAVRKTMKNFDLKLLILIPFHFGPDLSAQDLVDKIARARDLNTEGGRVYR